ncbi:MAG: OmpA family protein [Bacteroides sp.]|nr:OmpA family protein [Bacteroides sp.]MCM1379637.1 OmpA family protein [Bacteroides sp.]MCM1445981.1 OmpA family protein [Prevotella sp.]
MNFKFDRDCVIVNPELDTFCLALDSMYQAGDVVDVTVTGTASPEGSERYNIGLSQRRANALVRYLAAHTSLPDTLFSVIAGGEDWEALSASLPEYLSENKVVQTIAVINKYDSYDVRLPLPDLPIARKCPYHVP